MNKRMRGAIAMGLFAVAGLLGTAAPLLACHEPTGWCCTEHGFCCYWEDDAIVTCF